MTAGPSILEGYHDTPGIDELRACIHKQLGIDRLRIAEARREKHPRPAFPYMWILSPGRPMSVVEGYGFSPLPGFPSGFLGRHEADALGVVVLRELPRTRETLLLRLMGAGDVLRGAIAELMQLPDDAWEREVALEDLIALRFEMPQDPRTDRQREYLMSTHELYEHWKQHHKNAGVEQGVKGALRTLYRSRFGDLPPSIAAAIEATHDAATLDRWVALIGTASRGDVAAALGAPEGLPA